MQRLLNAPTTTYWIVIAGLINAGKSTFMDAVAERVVLRDSADMSLITESDQVQIMDWLQQTGGTAGLDAAKRSARVQGIKRWSRRVRIGEIDIGHKLMVGFYEAPGTRDLSFLQDAIQPDSKLGSIIMIDSTDHNSIRDASRLASALAGYANAPYIFVANKQDDPNAMPAEDIRILLQFLDGHLVPVVPCISTDASSVKTALLRLLDLVRESYDDHIEW
jgi:signal recognition particle receptor subunit beta